MKKEKDRMYHQFDNNLLNTTSFGGFNIKGFIGSIELLKDFL